MNKKTVYIVLLIGIWSIPINCLAVTWTDEGADHLWSTGENWDTGQAPLSSEDVNINSDVTGPIIESTVSAVANIIRVGGNSTTETITMTGGSLTTSSHFILGESSGSTATLTMSGGTVNAYSIWAGNSGDGYIDMTGGTINITNEKLYVARFGTGQGYINLDGGTINTPDLYMGGGLLDLEGGTLIIDGSKTGAISSYISSGYITAYDGTGTVNYDYNTTNAGKTTVTATSSVDTDPPTPNPATFSVAPSADSSSAISMTATTGSDASGPVEYYFDETSGNPGGTDSGWQTSASYTDTGLAASTQYTYTVTMRDSLGNTGTESVPANATTDAPPADTDPPTPNPATFASAPAVVSSTEITMTATTGSDASGPVEYLFTETSGNPGGTSSVWQISPSYTDSGLTAFTQYTYTVTMRDALGNTGTASAPANAATQYDPIFECDTFRIEFDPDGKVTSFFYKPLSRELITGTTGNDGFVVYDTAGSDVSLTDVYRSDDDRLLAKSGDDAYQVLMVFEEKEKHITFKIEQLVGFDPAENAKLRFSINPSITNSTFANAVPAEYGSGVGVGIMSLDWMTFAVGNFSVEWRYLWNSALNLTNPYGGFAIFACDENETLDTIGEIELAEGLPHPVSDGQWAKQDDTLARIAEMYVAFNGDAERNKAVDYCEQGGIGVFYIPQGVWEGGSSYTVNTHNFPDGLESLKEFSDELGSRGMLLGIHTGSCSLRYADKVYVSPVPDDRLASWGRGTLAANISDTDTVIYFTPDADTVIPSNTSQVHGLRPPVYPDIWEWEKIQIGNEVIEVGAYDESGIPWVLSGCVRGVEGTTSSNHVTDDDVKGLLSVYGHLAADPDSDLPEEIAGKMSDLVNYCNVGRLSFDALETIGSSGRWGMNKFMTKAYEGFDHYVLTDSSSGLPQYEWHVASFANNGEPMHFYPKAYFEGYLIGNDNDNFVPEGLGAITFRADSRINAWHASTPDEWQWWLAKAAAYDATYWFWSSVGELDANGQRSEILDLCKKWEQAKLKNVFTQSQMDQMKDFDTSFRLTFSDLSSRQWQITPVKIKTDFSKADGSSININNSYSQQPLHFEGRVLPYYDYGSAANEVVTPASLDDYEIDPGLTITKSGNKWTLSSSSAEALQGNWYCSPKDLSNKRGLGLWVTGYWTGGYVYVALGYGSKSRHYIIPNDVEGLRYVEIPDFEVADYGYRDQMYYDFQNPYGTIRQGFRYDLINRISIGLVGVPAGETALVAVENVKALAETEVSLTDMQLSISASSLTVDGSVDSGNYIVYEGGSTVEILDSNRNFVEELPVTLNNWNIGQGQSDVVVSSSSVNVPWVKLQFKTTDTPFSIPNPMDADLDDSGLVDVLDLEYLAENWLKDRLSLIGDLDLNGTVNIFDYALFATQWLDN